MNRITIILLSVAFLFQFSCKPEQNQITNDSIVTSYIDALNSSDFNQISELISDSLATWAGEFLLTKSKSEYYTHFKWDSVFEPEYRILEKMEVTDSSTLIKVSKLCKRIKFLHDSATVYNVLFDINNNQITKINNTELIVFDTTKWQSRRDTLVTWIDINHPKLNGFIYDQTMLGAQNYLKAIALFKEEY